VVLIKNSKFFNKLNKFSRNFLNRFYVSMNIIFLMGIRVTVVIDETNAEKLRNIQAKLIKTSIKSVSFSHVLNLVVEEGLRKFKH